jgi:hypothetical protein
VCSTGSADCVLRYFALRNRRQIRCQSARRKCLIRGRRPGERLRPRFRHLGLLSTRQPGQRAVGERVRGSSGGDLVVTSGSETDLDEIESDVRQLCSRFQVMSVGYDPWQSAQMSQRLRAEGVPMHEFRATQQCGLVGCATAGTQSSLGASAMSSGKRTVAAIYSDGEQTGSENRRSRCTHDGDPARNGGGSRASWAKRVLASVVRRRDQRRIETVFDAPRTE